MLRILMVYNYYQHRGGEGVAFSTEVHALREAGHHVDTLTLDNAVDLPEMNAVHLAARTIWSLDAYRKVKAVLREKKSDVLHVQNCFPLFSPSVYDAAKSCGVPVVQTLHNYRPFCMQTGLFREGQICTECPEAKTNLPGIRHRCYRGRLPASMAHGFMLEFHRLRKTWHRKVDAYIAVSNFVKQQYVSNGWDASSLYVKHNTVSPVPAIGSGVSAKFVAVGRLSEDKGLPILIEAWALLKNEGDGIKIPQLDLIGEGPLQEYLERDIIKRGLANYIHLRGRLSLEKTGEAIGDATATILPSVRYEPCSRSIVESYAKGTPVIAADIGGSSEQVEQGVSGALYSAGDATALASIIKQFSLDTDLMGQMRKSVREKFENGFSPQQNVRQLVDIYNQVLGRD